MNWDLFAAFLLITMILVVTPGPIVTLVIATGASQGTRAALTTVAGTTLGNALLIAAIAGGLSFVIAHAGMLFDVLRWIGAAYLIWLGIQTWRAPVADIGANDSPRETASRWAHFRGGFLVGISNPKLLVFAAAFFPQFITKSAPWVPQFGVLVATFLAVEACAYVTVASSARGLSRYLVQAAWQRRLNRLSGAIFAGFGVALLRYRP